MNEKDAREMLKELFERHKVPEIAIKFYPMPKTTQKHIETDLGGILTYTEKVTGTFMLNSITGEVWIEFYGLSSATTLRHEFRHYLEYLGKEYIRKRPQKRADV